MFTEIKTTILAVVIAGVLAGLGWLAVDYAEAKTTAGKYQTQVEEITRLNAKVVELEGRLAAVDTAAGGFVGERDNIHDFFGQLDADLWKDFQCGGLMVRVEDSTDPVDPVPAAPVAASTKSNTKVLNNAWIAYCASTVPAPPQCEGLQ